MNLTKTKQLVECSIMIALATVLSLVKIVELPYGGSITVASMLPIVIIAYRHGTVLGLSSGLVYGVLQQLLGLNTLSYFTTWYSVIAVMLLDYLIAFMVIGLAGVFRKVFRSQSLGLVSGAVLASVLRFACHVIGGATVWAGISIPTAAALVYSLSYNATYMLPETVILALSAYYLGEMIDFTAETPTRVTKHRYADKKSFALIAAGGLSILAGVIFDVAHVFSKLQNAETGEFDITGLANANYLLLLVVTLVAVAIACALFFFAKKTESKE